MTTFKNKSENEGWECEKINGTSHNEMDLKGEVDNTSFQNSNKTKKGRSKLKWISIILILSIITLSSLSYLNYQYSYSYLPHKVAEEYLNAIQMQDLTTTEKMWGLSGDSILDNLIDWEFADKRSIPSEKIEINLSEEAWKEEVEFALIAFRASSVDSLPLPEIIINGYRNYGVWFGNQSKSYKVFQEDGNYYYYTVPKVEYLLDIAGSNKIGMELRKNFILTVDKWNKGWEVTEFKSIS
jgi:hypothetical protein